MNGASCLKPAFIARSIERCSKPRVGTSAEAIIEHLGDAGAILFSEGGGTYRYHELFRSFVEERLRGNPQGLYRQIRLGSAVVCRRVGRWLMPSNSIPTYRKPVRSPNC